MAAHSTRKIHGDRGGSPVETAFLVALIVVMTLLTANMVIDATIDLGNPFERVSNEM